MKYLFLIITIVTIIFTSAVSIPGSPYLINNMTQADISNMFPSAITPAPITFSIWSLIYLSWIMVGIFLMGFSLPGPIKNLFPQNWHFSKYKKTPKNIILCFCAVVMLTGIWLLPWGYLMIGTSLLVMIIILGILKYIFQNSRDLHPIIRSSIELTLGWINIAMVANTTIWLLSIGFQGGNIPEIYWVIGVLGLALGLTIYYQQKYQAYIISLVYLWTLLGVWIAHPSYEQRFTVVILGIATLISIVISYFNKKKK
ncbi:hypothetical protein KBB25_02005 [Candidatus Gracilibacteria bacterium]|nr:hypothetical protein [Candidatus Gracilibacteria bacterium]